MAVKFIAGVAPDQAQRERFRTEARAIARVQHPNVVAIHRVGEIENRPYLVSELLQGDSLDRLPKPMPWSRVLAVGIGLARGLAAAHRRGVLHRDIKPANAMLAEDGQVKLLDFGVAKLLDAAGEPGEQEEPPPREGPAMAPPAVEDTVDLPSTTPPARRGPRPPPTGLVGTPLYMAPEVWLGEPATARSDLYSLGVLLYELCSGQVPHPAASRQELREAVLHRPFVPLAQVAPEVDPAFAAVLARCLAREPNERFASAEALREALEAIEERAREAGSPREQPYPGLHPFTAGDRATFFGRAAQVRAVVDRLRAEPLVVVAGDSGAGKSSLCRAGVLPRLAEGALGPGAVWVCRELLPGREPLRALAEALAPALGCAGVALLEELRQAPTELGRRVRALGGGRRMLVFVDQLEELLTLSTMAEVEHFGQALAALLDEGSGRVLATARGDFLARLAALPSLGERLAGGLYLLPQLGEAGLREAVVGPARAQGFTFETEEMVGALVAAGRAEGGLPLLQFALAELWERRDATRRVVPAKALVALGGVEGALARHADGVLASLRPGQRAAARRLLPRLVLAEGTRARRTAAELFGERGVTEEDARGALEALVRGRLV
ncbi:MAG TPA: serine/threonine-protein kinase, partial [Longimicrobium sp.]|nr:serine/threonine-protein kinase [Longimicrobium sp.]